MQKNSDGAQANAHQTRFLRTVEAAGFLGLSTSTLAKMRISGQGPRFTKSGSRIVLYDTADLQDWLDSRKRSSTSEGQ